MPAWEREDFEKIPLNHGDWNTWPLLRGQRNRWLPTGCVVLRIRRMQAFSARCNIPDMPVSVIHHSRAVNVWRTFTPIGPSGGRRKGTTSSIILAPQVHLLNQTVDPRFAPDARPQDVKGHLPGTHRVPRSMTADE